MATSTKHRLSRPKEASSSTVPQPSVSGMLALYMAIEVKMKMHSATQKADMMYFWIVSVTPSASIWSNWSATHGMACSAYNPVIPVATSPRSRPHNSSLVVSAPAASKPHHAAGSVFMRRCVVGYTVGSSACAQRSLSLHSPLRARSGDGNQRAHTDGRWKMKQRTMAGQMHRRLPQKNSLSRCGFSATPNVTESSAR